MTALRPLDALALHAHLSRCVTWPLLRAVPPHVAGLARVVRRMWACRRVSDFLGGRVKPAGTDD